MAASSTTMTFMRTAELTVPKEAARRQFQLALFRSLSSLNQALSEALPLSVDASQASQSVRPPAVFIPQVAAVAPIQVTLGHPDNDATYEELTISDLSSLHQELAQRIERANKAKSRESQMTVAAENCLSILRQVARTKNAIPLIERNEDFKVQIFYRLLQNTFMVYDVLKNKSDEITYFITAENFLLSRLNNLMFSLIKLCGIHDKLVGEKKIVQLKSFSAFLHGKIGDDINFNSFCFNDEDIAAVSYALIGVKFNKLDVRFNPDISVDGIINIINALSLSNGLGFKLIHNLSGDFESIAKLLKNSNVIVFNLSDACLSWCKPEEFSHMKQALLSFYQDIYEVCQRGLFPTYEYFSFLGHSYKTGVSLPNVDGCKIPDTVNEILTILNSATQEEISSLAWYDLIKKLRNVLYEKLKAYVMTQDDMTAIFYRLLSENLQQFYHQLACSKQFDENPLVRLANRLTQLIPVLRAMNDLITRLKSPTGPTEAEQLIKAEQLIGFLKRDTNYQILDLGLTLLGSNEIAAIAYALPGSYVQDLNLAQHNTAEYTSFNGMSLPRETSGSTNGGRITPAALSLLINAIPDASKLTYLNLMGLSLDEALEGQLVLALQKLTCQITTVIQDNTTLSTAISQVISERTSQQATKQIAEERRNGTLSPSTKGPRFVATSMGIFPIMSPETSKTDVTGQTRRFTPGSSHD